MSPPRARPRTAWSALALAALVRSREEELVHVALAIGLASARPRTLLDRVPLEALGFLRLLGAVLSAPASVERAVAREVQLGAFAGVATLHALRQIVSLWRSALEILGPGPRRGLAGVLVRLQALVWTRCRLIRDERIDVLAIGGSAGSFQALSLILGGLGAGSPATLVIVIHGGSASLPAVLASHTSMSVAMARQGSLLQRGCVLVAPPDRHLVVRGERIELVDAPEVSGARPSIDILMQSAATSQGGHLAAMLLSGSGTDGAAGMRAVRERGGVTLAQEPGSARFGRMPAAAISAGSVAIVRAAGGLRNCIHDLLHVS